jgi:hypothetical protein
MLLQAPRFRVKAGIMNTTPVPGGEGKLQVTPDTRPGYLEITAVSVAVSTLIHKNMLAASRQGDKNAVQCPLCV